MYIDHIHFLTKRAEWVVTNGYSFYTFEQEHFKKGYILGNKRARQKAVAREDDVQGNFWKLLNNLNFKYDCRDNSQNKSLHLIYNEEAEINFITKYDDNNSNCFLNLDAQLINVDGKYNNVKNHPEDEQPFAETLKKAEIKKLTEKFNKKKGKNTSKVLNYEDRLEEAYADKSYTFVQDLENDGINSAKAVSCKKNDC